MTPKFRHNHPFGRLDRFLGHFFGHDIYVLPGQDTIVARWGDEPSAYASQILSVFFDQLTDRDHTIGGPNMPTMPFQDYIFSPYVIPYHKAWLLALANGLRQNAYLLSKPEPNEETES